MRAEETGQIILFATKRTEMNGTFVNRSGVLIGAIVESDHSNAAFPEMSKQDSEGLHQKPLTLGLSNLPRVVDGKG